MAKKIYNSFFNHMPVQIKSFFIMNMQCLSNCCRVDAAVVGFGIIFYNENEHLLEEEFVCYLSKWFWKVTHNSDLEFINEQHHNSI